MRSRMRATAASRRASWKRSTTAAVKDGVTTRRPSCVESCDGCGHRPPALLHLPHLLCIHKCDLQVVRGGIAPAAQVPRTSATCRRSGIAVPHSRQRQPCRRDTGNAYAELCQTRMTLIPIRVNAATISSEAPASVTSTSTSSIGQIKEGLTMPSLLESATTMICLACLTIARNVRASSDSLVVVPRSASMPETLRNSLSRKLSPRKLMAAAPTSENDHGQWT